MQAPAARARARRPPLPRKPPPGRLFHFQRGRDADLFRCRHDRAGARARRDDGAHAGGHCGRARHVGADAAQLDQEIRLAAPPAGAPRARPKLPPEKEGPARRIYESGAQVGDLAVLLDCHESYVHRVAKQRGWRRPGTNAAAADLPAALAESEATRATYDAIAARLREPDLPRHELLRLAQMGQAVALVEMLAGATEVEGRVDAAVQLARLASELPEEPPVPRQLSPEEQE